MLFFVFADISHSQLSKTTLYACYATEEKLKDDYLDEKIEDDFKKFNVNKI